MKIQIKRIYEDPAQGDGFRALVDRLWPRGVSKDTAELDVWAKDVAPSSELRTSCPRDTEHFLEFRELYLKEIRANGVAIDALLAEVRKSRKTTLTLLYASREAELNHAVVLKEGIEKHVRAAR